MVYCTCSRLSLSVAAILGTWGECLCAVDFDVAWNRVECDGLLCFRRCTGRCQIGGFQHGHSKLRKGQERMHALRMLIAAGTRSDEVFFSIIFLIHKVIYRHLIFREDSTNSRSALDIDFERAKEHEMHVFCKCLKCFLH